VEACERWEDRADLIALLATTLFESLESHSDLSQKRGVEPSAAAVRRAELMKADIFVSSDTFRNK
jgi:hypothetical protein